MSNFHLWSKVSNHTHCFKYWTSAHSPLYIHITHGLSGCYENLVEDYLTGVPDDHAEDALLWPSRVDVDGGEGCCPLSWTCLPTCVGTPRTPMMECVHIQVFMCGWIRMNNTSLHHYIIITSSLHHIHRHTSLLHHHYIIITSLLH